MAIFTIDDISTDTEARFLRKVDRRGPNECWPWTAHRGVRGYGHFKLSTKRAVKATHVSLILSGRPRPTEKHGACHRCDNPPCCNPAHLFWGTQAANNADAAAKGRKRPQYGSSSWQAKLTEPDVLKIRASKLGCVALGRTFGISPSHVNNIRKRRVWKHI